jgi:hypothetical protein
MKFTQRLGYYLGGFGIGLIILMFFLNGKKASCDYGPNARTVKNISSKPLTFSKDVADFVSKNKLDTTTIRNLIKYGKVDFGNSMTKLDSCKIYSIQNTYKNEGLSLRIENCDKIATIISIENTSDYMN